MADGRKCVEWARRLALSDLHARQRSLWMRRVLQDESTIQPERVVAFDIQELIEGSMSLPTEFADDEEVMDAIERFHREYDILSVGQTVCMCLDQAENYLARTFVKPTPEMVDAGEVLRAIKAMPDATTAEEAVARIKMMVDVVRV